MIRAATTAVVALGVVVASLAMPGSEAAFTTRTFVATATTHTLPASTTTTTTVPTTTTSLAPAAISGRVLSDTGTPTDQGRAEVFDSDLNHVGTHSTGSDGRYETDGLPPDDYYVLLYNGDDELFVDFFAEWWMDAPLLRLDQARIVRVAGQDVTGIDARLNPLFIDMFDNIFLDDIAFMQEAGITKGCNPPVNDLYCPDDFVTRAQMAAFLVRAFGYTDDGGGDLFVDDDGSTFETDIDRLGTAGVTRGCNPPSNDRFCPNDFVTRGQMAAFLNRALSQAFSLASADHESDRALSR